MPTAGNDPAAISIARSRDCLPSCSQQASNHVGGCLFVGRLTQLRCPHPQYGIRLGRCGRTRLPPHRSSPEGLEPSRSGIRMPAVAVALAANRLATKEAGIPLRFGATIDPAKVRTWYSLVMSRSTLTACVETSTIRETLGWSLRVASARPRINCPVFRTTRGHVAENQPLTQKGTQAAGRGVPAVGVAPTFTRGGSGTPRANG